MYCVNIVGLEEDLNCLLSVLLSSAGSLENLILQSVKTVLINIIVYQSLIL
jgi:hypothetical protein